MATVIRLSRRGRTHLPFFHVVVCEARSRREGAPVETLGWFDPRRRDQQYRLDLERVRYWLGVGAKPSATVASLFKRAGLSAEMWMHAKKRSLAHRASARRERAKREERKATAGGAGTSAAAVAQPAAAAPAPKPARKKHKPRTANSKDRKARKAKVAAAPAAS